MRQMIDLIDLWFLEASITKLIGRVSPYMGDRLDRPDRQEGIIKEKIKITENPQKVSIKSINKANLWESKGGLIDTQVYQCLSVSISRHKSLESKGFKVSIREGEKLWHSFI